MKEYLYSTYFISYIVISLIYVLFVVLKESPKHKLINIAILGWLVTFNSYNSSIAWHLFPQLFRLKNGDQILSVFLMCFIVLSFLSNKKKNRQQPLISYEKYLYYYLILSIFIIYLHKWLGNISEVRSSFFLKLYFTALFLHYLMKRYMTIEMIRSVIRVIIYLGVCSSIAGVVQFFIDEDFLRISNLHNAFSTYYRPSGVFRTPYDHGLFVILSIFTVAYAVKDIKLRVFLITFFIISLVLIFSRGIWITFLLVLFFHLLFLYRERFKNILIIFGISVAMFLMFSGFHFVTSSINAGSALTDRIFVDTVSVRFGYYGFILKTIPKSLLIGFGDIQDNNVYFNGMIALNQGLNWALGKEGGIHNLILEETFLRGIVAAILFLNFFFRFFKYNFNKIATKRNYIFCLSNYFVLSFFIYEFTISGFLVTSSGMLTMFFMAIVSGIHFNNIDISEFSIKGNEKFNSEKN